MADNPNIMYSVPFRQQTWTFIRTDGAFQIKVKDIFTNSGNWNAESTLCCRLAVGNTFHDSA